MVYRMCRERQANSSIVAAERERERERRFTRNYFFESTTTLALSIR